jgi:hypothetical protein
MGPAGLSAVYHFFSSLWQIISRIDSLGLPRTMRCPVMWKLLICRSTSLRKAPARIVRKTQTPPLLTSTVVGAFVRQPPYNSELVEFAFRRGRDDSDAGSMGTPLDTATSGSEKQLYTYRLPDMTRN